MTITLDVSGVLAALYTDRMTVCRYTNTADGDGALVSALDPAPVLEDVPCRVSFNNKDSPVISGDGNSTDIQPVLFCRPDVPLKSGDFVTVTRLGSEIYSGHIGRPNPYGSSLQVMFRDKGGS